MKAIGNFVMSASLFVSCGQAPQPPKQAPDTLSPAVTTAPALTSSEMRHYSGISTQFFDKMLAGRFNGSVLVAKNGVVVFERYHGLKHPGKKNEKDSLDEHTSFHLASVSKTFTAMATLKLWQDGKLDIHDSVHKYLPAFPADGTTIENLLSHRSGLSNYVHFMDASGWNKHQMMTNADVLNYLSTHIHETRNRPPGKHFEYSNTNYALLALIIEKVSGLPYPEFMARTFFQPLQMNDTYVYTQADSARSMISYYQTGRPFRIEYNDMVYGDKNIYSTVRDLNKWDQALRGGQLFTKQVLDSAYAPYSFEKPGQRNYGLGWRMLLIPNGKKLIYHNGWWHGNRTVFVRMLDENATIIALCNNDYKRVYNSKQLSDLFGDYRQGQTFEDSDSDPSDPSGSTVSNGDPSGATLAGAAPTQGTAANPTSGTAVAARPATTAKTASVHHTKRTAARHHVVKKAVRKTNGAVASQKKKAVKKKPATAAASR